MRHLAIGDIHGCFCALIALIEEVALQPTDVVITVGDYIDRGPHSFEVIDYLIRLSENHRLIALCGNHEVMMLKARQSSQDFEEWLGNGGNTTLKSYSPFGDRGRLADVPDNHWRFLENLLHYWETDSYFVVHANAYPDMNLDEQPEYMLFWEQFNAPPPHDSGKKMICGHTSQKSGTPKNIGHAICIDTRVYDQGWLTCLDILSGTYWQANEQGEVRRRHLLFDENED